MLTAERLRELLHYDPLTGVFTWLVSTSNRVHVGDEAGGSNGGGYLRIRVEGVSYYAHRLAWLHVTGRWPPSQIDHENRNKADNTWSNLRPATHKQNRENTPPSRSNTSGVKGVYWDRVNSKWAAQIVSDRAHTFLGRFNQREDAIAARLAAERKLYTHSEACA